MMMMGRQEAARRSSFQLPKAHLVGVFRLETAEWLLTLVPPSPATLSDLVRTCQGTPQPSERRVSCCAFVGRVHPGARAFVSEEGGR